MKALMERQIDRIKDRFPPGLLSVLTACLAWVPCKLKVTVPRSNLTLSETYADHYFTPSALIQSKNYSPGDIIQFVRTQPVVLEYDVHSVNLELSPPDLPTGGAFFPSTQT
ncbi:hypothetical protein N8198_06720 [Gammaproteobacteria bacterium]|nr:hypothetical protein [Gammaproteobacteria bacterium]